MSNITVTRDCAAEIIVTISGENISTYEEAVAIAKMLSSEISDCKYCEVTLEDNSFESGGEAAEEPYVSYAISCEWDEWVECYKGAGTHDDYDEIDGSEDPAGDMMYAICNILENHGYRIIGSFVAEDNCESLEDIAEQFSNDEYDDRDYWDEYDPCERDSRGYDYDDL